MATTGTYAFTLDIAEMMTEAFERCGVEPASIESEKIDSAIRSINLMLKEWTNRTTVQWKIDSESQALTQGTGSFTLPTGSMDVLQATLNRDSTDIPMVMISRQEWIDIPDKTTQGRPNRYWPEKLLGAVTVHLWPVPENSTDVMDYYRFIQFEDAGEPINNIDVQQRWLDASIAGITWRLSEKYAPGLEARKLALYERAFKFADDEERERGPTVMRVDLGHRGRRW